MKSGLPAVHIGIALLVALLWSLTGAPALLAQNATGSLHGQVVDPSGGAVPNAPVKITTPAGQMLTATSNASGAYEFNNLAPGKYTVEATVKGFAPYRKEAVEIAAGQAAQLNVTLSIEGEKQEVTVSDQAQSVDTTPSANASAVVLTEKELEALSDDPDELQQDLEALAGPSAGPNGGQMYIDGFTAGQLPPKSSIREIRINQNPFSAEYDKLGYGRIEILTKPGTDQWHGEADAMGNDSALNTRSPFLGNAEQPGYYSDMVGANIGGPLAKNASFFFDVQRRSINDLSIINAAAPPDYTLGDFTQGIPNYRT